jgi:hypothetical protein
MMSGRADEMMMILCALATNTWAKPKLKPSDHGGLGSAASHDIHHHDR